MSERREAPDVAQPRPSKGWGAVGSTFVGISTVLAIVCYDSLPAVAIAAALTAVGAVLIVMSGRAARRDRRSAPTAQGRS